MGQSLAKMATVNVDDKGRVLIPAPVRQELRARRFKLSLEKGRIMMEPVEKAQDVKGKYKGLVKVSMEELEEKQERYIAAGHR